MKLKPAFARVIIERANIQKSTIIIIPDTVQKRHAPAWGKLVAAGPNCEDEVKALVGKTVMFGQHAGAWIKPPEGDEIFICQEEDILAEVT